MIAKAAAEDCYLKKMLDNGLDQVNTLFSSIFVLMFLENCIFLD